MEIRALDRSAWAGHKITVRYDTDGYYDVAADGFSFAFRYVPFKATAHMSFEDRLFGDWLEDPVALGAFEGERLLGIAEGSPERWNNRFRVSNLVVFEAEDRGRGVGRALMDAMLDLAARGGARMAVLETQSCNTRAIEFYRKCGFEVIGFDLYAYTNHDPQRHEVRVEMGKKLRGEVA